VPSDNEYSFEPPKQKKYQKSIDNTGRQSTASIEENTIVVSPKNNIMFTISNESLSTGNAPQLEPLIDFASDEVPPNNNVVDKYYSKTIVSNDDISLPDEVDAFPIVVSEEEEKMQTIDPDNLREEQDASRLTPLTILTSDTIGALRSRKLLKVLLDPGSTYTFIHGRALPKHCQPVKIQEAKKVNTISGTGDCNELVILRDIRLPEFDKSRRVNQQKAMVFDCHT